MRFPSTYVSRVIHSNRLSTDEMNVKTKKTSERGRTKKNGGDKRKKGVKRKKEKLPDCDISNSCHVCNLSLGFLFSARLRMMIGQYSEIFAVDDIIINIGPLVIYSEPCKSLGKYHLACHIDGSLGVQYPNVLPYK